MLNITNHCCCKVASVVSESVRPHRLQPTRLPHLWDSPGKNTGVGCHFLLQCMKVKSESEVKSCPSLSDPPWTVAYQAPPSMGFSRQEYWSALPLPSPRGTPALCKLERTFNVLSPTLLSVPSPGGDISPDTVHYLAKPQRPPSLSSPDPDIMPSVFFFLYPLNLLSAATLEAIC